MLLHEVKNKLQSNLLQNVSFIVLFGQLFYIMNLGLNYFSYHDYWITGMLELNCPIFINSK